MRTWVFALALVSWAGCDGSSKDVETVPVGDDAKADKKDEPEVPYVPAGELRARHGVIKFAVYAMPYSKGELAKAAKDVRARDYAHLHLVEGDEGKKTPSLFVLSPPMHEFEPPTMEELRVSGRGVTQEQAMAVQQSSEAVVLAFAGTPEELPKLHRDALKLTHTVASESGGLIWDEDTQQMFSAEAWASRLEADPFQASSMGYHFVIRSSRGEKLVRQITFGMQKFALPDILARDVPPSLVSAMSRLINLVAASLVASPVLAKQGEIVVDFEKLGMEVPLGAEPRITVALTRAKRTKADPENRILEIAFLGSEEKRHEEMNALLAKVTGVKDKVSKTELDPQIVQASLEARKRLRRLKPEFQKGLAKGETLMVKAPFQTRDQQQEWMWVEVFSWEDETLSGILQNEPRYVQDLESGSKVQVAEAKVFDYLIRRADGTVVGNETGKLMAAKDDRMDGAWSVGLDPFAGQKKLGQ